ncbi:neuraminidase-like domain-containing protein [Streptomyces sp. NPDC005953]|uniref:Tc toxin subunit A-related protein n=1 Tax=Streptomyces sp. NPDC005953 TaxID=3156719 RepID=UPI00340F7F56
MASLIVIRIHPVEPVDGPAFTGYLNGLTIKAWDLSTNSPLEGVEVGTATYRAPENPALPWVPHPRTTIVQHFSPVIAGQPPILPQPLSVATAVIKVPDPPDHPEHLTRDLRLEISRAGKRIVHRQIYVNVPEANHAWPMHPADMPGLGPSLFLALPAASLDSQNPLELPANGTPPRFTDLRTAVLDVLGNDPGDPGILGALTPQQARHLAYEIVWNRTLRPLPLPDPYTTNGKRSLEAMYTGRKRDDDESEQARRRFEGEQQAYYAKGNAEAERLSGFVYALSTAVAAEADSRAAERAGLDFPVLLGPPSPDVPTGARYREAKVILTGLDTLPEPRFGVPAAYFYVLSATMPTSVTAAKRYELALLAEPGQTRDTLRAAVALGVLEEEADQDGVGFAVPLTGSPLANISQAARRLRALGAATGPAAALPASSVRSLVESWLAVKEESTEGFWAAPTSPVAWGAPHLELVLTALTAGHGRLISAIKAFPVSSAAQLAERTPAEWRDRFGRPVDILLLPPFITGGSPDDRVNAFIRHVAKFFTLRSEPGDREDPTPGAPSRFRELTDDPLTRFVGFYDVSGPDPFVFGTDWDRDRMRVAVADVFPGDREARVWLEQLIRTVDELVLLAGAVDDEDLRFSLMEALFARGFTSRDQVRRTSAEDFTRALTGTVAYDLAHVIHEAAGDADPNGRDGGFVPVNPDGSLVDCVPPDHLSPLGPVAYLHELLRLSSRSTCEDPTPGGDFSTLGDLVAARRGPLGELRASEANLGTPLPLIDLVNECLEAAAGSPGEPVGAVHDTSETQVTGDRLHDPATLFAAVPEHSTPATPVARPEAYDVLRQDFSAPVLPYSQALDINRTYLRQLGTSRYDTLRRFRRDITEHVLDPVAEPVGFQRHLWRYPVRGDLAPEYLGITPEEATLLYRAEIGTDPPGEAPEPWELYGFPTQTTGERHWTEAAVRLDEFLIRTGLTYCEFLDLWRSRFVIFHNDPGGERNREGDGSRFPDCEPCHLDDYRLRFTDPPDTAAALTRLAVFIRLRRSLSALPGGGYGFDRLRDICAVLGLYRPDGSINPDFLRQLAAFQILRDDFGLALSAPGRDDEDDGSGSRRTPLLALWEGPEATHWDWAVDELLDQVQQHARARHGCGHRPPEFRKLLAENLDTLARLAGFGPAPSGEGGPDDSWRARPTHTLRFAEVLGKIYASDFGIGEILFLFTADDHLGGDDPFPLQPQNEALDSPLGLPDDETGFSLWSLRDTLLAVEVTDEEASAWTWPRIVHSLRDDFGFAPPIGGPDPLLVLGQHLFPTVLTAAGYQVSDMFRQYRTPLPLHETSPAMWNTPLDGPFRYDSATEQLWTRIPLTDEAVIAKLSRIRQLKPGEQTAVQELYFRPRADLTPFALVFGNPAESEERLLQEEDEERRWSWFQAEFARFHARCAAIANHLSRHVRARTGSGHTVGRTEDGGGERNGLAWTLLRQLFADENRALGPWESDSGAPPAVTWPDRPSGGAFAALLGLVGTGLLGELTPDRESLIWRETRGPLSAFTSPQDAANAAHVQIPTVLPSLGLTLTEGQERFVRVRNGFALANPDGRPLGGAQGYTARWSGQLLVDAEGPYDFLAGAPTPQGQPPDARAAQGKRWRVTLRRGQRSWVLLSHHWPDETAPAHCSGPLNLRRGVYRLTVELIQPSPEYDSPEDVCPIVGGFEIKYAGPDSAGQAVTIPYERLFRDRKDQPLSDGLRARGAAGDLLRLRFTSTLRDVRRTYQRAFKALLFAQRFGLRDDPMADDGQSEIGYLLAHPAEFSGRSSYRRGAGFAIHQAHFDVNLLPVKDNYHPPTPGQDRRARPTPRRQQALFDWWERIFDYTAVRRATRRAPEDPLWLLFHEAAENHPDDPAHLLRHMGVDLLHTRLVLRFHAGHAVTGLDLLDERWTVRVFHADRWVRAVRRDFLVDDIRTARPDLWAAVDPGETAAGESESGNRNLTRFVRDGCIENGEPLRHADVQHLNDGLRERARTALASHLCAMDRVRAPDGTTVTEPGGLAEVLLIDVATGLCRRASRIEEAIGAVQLFVRRALLGLEPRFTATPAFRRLWERSYANFALWAAYTGRQVHRENWIDWDEFEHAHRSEAFRFLTDELRRSALTVAVPGGLEHWPGPRPPGHPGLTPLQAGEPAGIASINPAREGYDLLGTPERHATPSWLSARALPSSPQTIESRPDQARPDQARAVESRPDENEGLSTGSVAFPLWIEAAIRLGTRFVRVAAAAEPPASTRFVPRADGDLDASDAMDTARCACDCGSPHPPVIDEYYFWTVDARQHEAQEQQADWDWHTASAVPRLLHWDAERTVWLAWCRVHNGQFTQPRRSAEAIRVADGGGDLEFLGRTADSLLFRIVSGVAPPHHPLAQTGFRYDLPTDEAFALPLVVEPVEPPDPDDGYPGALPAYPYFGYHRPGAPPVPSSPYAIAVAAAGVLRTHCRYEAALAWYDLAFSPLSSDARWWGAPEPEVSARRARRRSITLHYTETLFQWGDAELARNTPESFEHARLIFATAARLLGRRPRTLPARSPARTSTVDRFIPLPAPINPRLLALYDQGADRLALIESCLNAARLHNGDPERDMPYWGTGQPQDGRPCPDAVDRCAPHSPYRFVFLVQKAAELAGEVRALGAALLAAHEKGDAEYLVSLRATQETQLLSLMTQVRQNQWRESDWQVQALRKTKEITQTRRNYYALLIQNGLISKEIEHENLTGTGMALRTASNVTEGIAQVMSLIPDMFVGFPCNQIQPPVGSKLGGVFSAAARITNGLADIASTTAGLRLTQSGWERREEEWRHQVEVLDIELEQVERQILSAERRRDLALHELNSHQRQLEHSAEVRDYLRSKFTSHELYLHLQQETAALHHRMSELAFQVAHQAQRAFNIEHGHTARDFLPRERTAGLRESLLVGERLQLALRRMEHAYLDANLREYELTKHFSLRRDFPLQFLLLQATGSCEIELDEWMFDQDHGHYLRRIKSVALTIPCVVGPYAGVHCRLTLLSSRTRISPALTAPATGCCPGGEPNNGYPALPDDPRIVHEYVATEAIATSTGQNDTGMFELNFRDERRLPFEFRGAVSRWRIDMRPENNRFDLDTVSDVVLHLNYTAREGGDVLRSAAEESSRRRLPGSGVRYFDVRYDMTAAWQDFRSGRRGEHHQWSGPAGTDSPGDHQGPDDRHGPGDRHGPVGRELALRLGRSMFPFLPGGRDVRLTSVEIFFETVGVATPGEHHLLHFRAASDHGRSPTDRCPPTEVRCVASVDRPGLFHGVLRDPALGRHLSRAQERHLGSLSFPDRLPEVTRILLLCGYEVC